ncbi:DNA sulfur modification protein DndD [Sinobaca qinghaiensis]|uniref:Nuclease SbcCD subunit C n=1 Tax=Sinobaca qinghaiensis TaxID=342944 RepID=A0A419V0A8_9BACL|nr:AAA family ATPase [Sinobaca qinghaiensis]RKD71382.1 DNA sulfur modification protein DndD [Sinobaca qinghaiensis]
MRFYLKKFIEDYYQGKSDTYKFILWATYKNLKQDGRLSSMIKEELADFNLNRNTLSKKVKKGDKIISHLTVKQKEGITYDYPTIDSIQIKNFRGFGSLNEEDYGIFIPLNKNKNIFFGPNGSGKTSFCEAFEFKLTSNLKEAKRRNVTVSNYAKRNSEKPKIDLKFNHPHFSTESLSELEYEYFQISFIEKNRLQEFALLGSKDTGVREKDIVANLLGMQELDNLVSSFVKPISFNIDELLEEKQKKALKKLREHNETNLNIKKEYESDIYKIVEDVKKKYQISLSEIEDLIKEKNSNIKHIDEKIESLHKHQIKYQDYKVIIKNLFFMIRKLKDYNGLKDELAEQAINMDYESFYTTLKNIINSDLTHCPSCETPLSQVTKHPEKKAEKELAQLKEVTNLKKAIKDLEESLSRDDYNYVRKMISDYKENSSNFQSLKNKKIDQIVEKLNVLEGKDTTSTTMHLEEFIKNIYQVRKEIKTYFINLEIISSEIEVSGTKTVELEREREKINSEVSDLSTLLRSFNYINNKLSTINSSLTEFTQQEETLREAEKKEEEYNLLLQEVKEDYAEFYNDLNSYKLKLESGRLSNVEEALLKYYSLINTHDDKSEQVTNIKFNLIKGNYRIYVTKSDGMEIDAYTFLSEGHLRALGLALMLAVAESNNVPFLIFDDVVNAIDSDHRANIISMLYNEAFLKKTQLIITTHDRLFWERFCNQYSTLIDRKNVDNISYVINHTNMGTVLTQYNIGFEDKIKEALRKYDIRQALIYCRIWFETFSTQYCVDSKAELTGRFTNIGKTNLLQPSLESIYTKLLDDFPGNVNLLSIKKDLINWSAQNQEHHSFDEHSLNFVHSKNSDEVSAIYHSIKRFKHDMNPESSIIELESELVKTQIKIDKSNRMLQDQNFIDKADPLVVLNERNSNSEYKSLKTEINEELDRLRSSIPVSK